MAKKKAEDTINLDAILFKCRDILRAHGTPALSLEKRDMMLTLVSCVLSVKNMRTAWRNSVRPCWNRDLTRTMKISVRRSLTMPPLADGTYNLPAGGKMVYHHQYACTQAECSTGQCTSQHCGRLQAAEMLLCGRHLYHTQPCRKRHQKADR